ncbi:unnamed protein product [Alternaria alternata]
MSAAEIPVTRELESCRRTSTFDTVSEAPSHHPPQSTQPSRHVQNVWHARQRLQASPYSRIPFDPTRLTIGCSAVLRSNTTMLFAVFGSAFGLQLAFDTGSEKIWDSINRGRQWKDIKQRYMEAAEDDE